MFPVNEAAKAKSLGFTAQELKAMTVATKDIYFTGVKHGKTGEILEGAHHGTRAGRCNKKVERCHIENRSNIHYK